MPWDEFYQVERCESGRIGQSRKLLSWQRDRGFDPHPLRQIWVRWYTSVMTSTSGRGDLANSDRSIRGSLAQHKPCTARPTQEQAPEKDEAKSSTWIQCPSRLGRNQGGIRCWRSRLNTLRYNRTRFQNGRSIDSICCRCIWWTAAGQGCRT
jgi:hypothetical protein